MKDVHTKVFSGRPAAQGIGIGKVWQLREADTNVHPQKISESQVEENIQKFLKARELVCTEYEKLKYIPEEDDLEEIINAQIQILYDPEVTSAVKQKIEEEHFAVEYAIFNTLNNYIQLMENSGSSWAKDRTIDIVSIRDELIRATKEKKKGYAVKEGEIVFAGEVSPTAMVQLSRNKIAGLVMEKGGLTSHAVILSQSLGIPCVINVHWNRYDIQNGSDVIIDGTTGQVIINPSWKQKEEYKRRKEDERKRFEKALEWAKKPNKTTCGTEFSLRANIEFLEELPRLNTHGAEGVGLLRTETVLFESDEFDVDKQIAFYSKVLEAVREHSVTIRLFDAGGDKLLEDAEFEDNPFLGWRGVRMLLDKKNFLKNQIEAIFRVSGKFDKEVKILIPMVSRMEEIHSVKQVIEEVKANLLEQEIPFNENIQLGVMVEVPSIALMSEQVAQHVDFFSIGTNDLTQYTLAVDRGNEKISHLFDSFHPSIWKLIKMTKDAADKHNIPVAICGEMASKPEAAACLLGLGIKDLSMNTGSIPIVKSVLCSHSYKEMHELSEKVLSAKDLDEVHELLDEWRVL
ncbi:MAG: phosphoenolpyruvate--protein phosphotransferase [Balneolaceae bacterium]|nr:phosphoenolpyruvate--protein phosphotransferase [Balneolaceae bacterium]